MTRRPPRRLLARLADRWRTRGQVSDLATALHEHNHGDLIRALRPRDEGPEAAAHRDAIRARMLEAARREFGEYDGLSDDDDLDDTPES